MNAGRFKSDWATRCGAALLAFSMLLASGIALGADVPIFLGSVGVGKAKPEVQTELRSLLRAELAAPEFSRLRTSERYVLAATLVRLDTVQSASDSARATCVVSVAILRDGSTLHALINGRATAEEARAPAARSDALRAAVHSAMVRVPKALR
jgi:hypothetical protein